jgi:tRNA nucleotidyltransferase (CCA-adding enzyme)
MLEIYLPSDVIFIIDRMHSCGYSAHVVGGSVRDSLIGRELEDFDITTDALPEQTKAVFSDYRTVDTGIRHGTVTLVLNAQPYEITTYRVDGDYKDNRHPESVTFTASLEEDLARRDFTVNAMAYSPSVGLVDPFDGVHDLQRRIIRAVGDPYRRFNEDALRILRALRFSSTLGFDIDESTSKAARELSSNLESISKERVYTELKKLISGTNAHRVLLEYADIIAVAFGGLYVKELPNYERFLNADYFTRLAAIFDMNSEDPISVADNVLASLKTDKLTRTHTVSVLRAYKEADFTDERAALKTLARYGKEATDGALSLGILEKRFTNSDREVLMGALNSAKPYTVSGLALRGSDLLAIGFKGEAIGASLEKLLYAVIDGSVENEKSALIAYLSRDAEV